jgi:excisionase family DNA binding protein
MAAKLIDLEEAAAKLGVTTDQLIEMLSRGEIYGYRADNTWKFKEDEVDRVIAERAGGGSGIGGDLDDLIQPLGLEDDANAGLSSILVSEQELGHSGESTSSTIIGKAPEIATNPESDITLASESAIGPAASDVQLVSPNSDLNLASTSDVQLAGLSDLQLSADGGTGKAPGSDVVLGTDKIDLVNDSNLELGADDDLVLGGSGIGSDVTLGGGDSGINLASPADSGLSLEEPIELMGGSSVESAFELPEDEEVISLSSDIGISEEATILKADDEFMLSTGGDLGSDESDSGSQVIALEDSEAFDENAATMLRPNQPGLVVEDLDSAFDGLGGGETTGATPAAAGAPGYLTAAPPEAPYTVMNVAALVCCVFLLMITGMLMTDLMRNMWAFDTDRMMSTSLMDGILSALGMAN